MAVKKPILISIKQPITRTLQEIHRPDEVDVLLLEDGFSLLLEDGQELELEPST